MRVALVTDWYLPRLGGIETQVAGLAPALAARGHEVKVFTTTKGAPASEAVVIAGARLPPWQVGISPRLRPRLEDALRAFGPDIVHCHASVVSPLAYAGIAAARRLDIGCVVTFHSLVRSMRHGLRISDLLWGWAGGRVALAGVSRLVAGQLERALPGRAVMVLPNGVDLTFWTARRDRRPGRPLIVVSAMRLTRKKQPLALLEAFAAMDRQDARLVIPGEGPLAPALRRRIAALGLSDAISMPGRLGAEGLRALHAQADLFVLPSDRESFGIAALEARAAGLPVIAMAGTGATDFIAHGEDGLIAQDRQGLREALAAVSSDEGLRRRLTEAAPDLARFDWPAVAARHEEVYARLAHPVRSA